MEFLEYESQHNHLEKEYEASKSIVKRKIKETIRKSPFSLDIRPKSIFSKISQDMGLICPEFNTIRTQIIRSQNKQLPPDITTFEEIPEESVYYKTENSDNFMIFKNPNLIIFQSPFQEKLFTQYNEDIFADGIIYIAPKSSYQVLITRIYVEKINSFYTTSISILKNKKQSTYDTLFKEIKKMQVNLVTVLFCSNEINNNNNLYNYYRAISNFSFINPIYIPRIYLKTKNTCKKKMNIIKYFDINYLNKYYASNWNHYNNKEHITNNKEEGLSTDEIKVLIEFYKNKKEKLICIGCYDDDIVELWYDCLIHLNNIKY
ncbi:hypothetical protein H8356DRAFT_1372676 [Neocallimastix lanati (nom. inval.)]|nr:hypothetical protein H8356DRAFT_1372676 [Neocallimastix sp. JGI-2020a]